MYSLDKNGFFGPDKIKNIYDYFERIRGSLILT